MIEEPLTVLIADDEAAARRYLRRQLQDYDLDLEITGEARTGPELLEILADGAPDVLMLDIMMPGFSGLEALERLHGRYRDMRVLIVSAYDRFSFAPDAVRLGVEDFLVKPVRPRILRKSFIDCVQKVYRGRKRVARHLRMAERASLAERILNLAYVTDQQLVSVAQSEPEDGDVAGVLSIEERLKSEVRSGSLEETFSTLGDLTREAVHQDPGFLEIELIAAITSACQVACSHMAESKKMLGLRNESIREILQAGTPEEMVTISRECLARIFEYFRSMEDRKQRLVSAARAFIDDNVGTSLSLGEVAKAVYVSSYYLSRVFKEVCGQSFSEYLTSLRLERSKELLRHSDLSCGDVGLKVGYSSASYFSQIFKQRVGMTPSQYRAS